MDGLNGHHDAKPGKAREGRGGLSRLQEEEGFGTECQLHASGRRAGWSITNGGGQAVLET